MVGYYILFHTIPWATGISETISTTDTDEDYAYTLDYTYFEFADKIVCEKIDLDEELLFYEDLFFRILLIFVFILFYCERPAQEASGYG